MKQLTKQKWILSTLLIAALGSQYYFSVSSSTLNAIELASRAPADEAPAAPAPASGDATRASGDATVASGDATRASGDATVASGDATAASGDASTAAATEATGDNASPVCTDCVQLVVPREQATFIRELLARVASGDRSALVAAVSGDRSPTAPPADETAAERRQRQREERLLAERERRAELEDEFQERVEDLSSRCGDDVECLSSGFSLMLNRYTGSKALSVAVVRQAYREHIETRLRDAMLNGDEAAATRALNALSSDMPSAYNQVKTTVVDTVKAVATERATSINNNFRLAQQLGQQNQLVASNQAFQQALTDQASFQRSTQVYAETLTDTLRAARDNTTLAYVQSNFLPAMSNLFTTLGSTATTGDTTTAAAGATRGTIRGGGTTTLPGAPAASVAGTGGAVAPTAPLPGGALNNAIFGTPTPAGGTRGGRGSY